MSFFFIFFAGAVVGAYMLLPLQPGFFLKPTGWGMSVVEWKNGRCEV